MDSGGMIHPLAIQRGIQVGVSSLNEPVIVWQDYIATVFSSVEVRRGREHFDTSTKQRYSEDVWHFRVHFYDVVGINAAMRVIDEYSRAFDIKSIREDEQDRESILIECTLQDAVVGSAPLEGYIDEFIAAGETGVVYAGFSIRAKGGTSPYTYAVSTGALPAGLALDANTGAISGTPTAAGSSAFVVTVSDAAAATHALPGVTITVA